MFKFTMITLSLLLSSLSVHAQVLSAEDFGLTPDTGYLTAVSDPAECKSPSQILYKTDSAAQYISKCDGSNIGWVERIVNGDDLEMLDGRNEPTINIVSYHNRNSYGRPSKINIYTCDRYRENEFVNETIKPSKDAVADSTHLRNLMKQKANFKVQLFYNEFVLSGKCIGRITVL